MPDLLQQVLQQMSLTGGMILIFFSLLFLTNAVFLLLFVGRVAWLRMPEAGRLSPLSVMLPLRNEEENLKKNLPGLLSFKDLDYEIVAVDDFSGDSSLTILGAFMRENPKLRFSALSQETRYSEKMSRNIAVKSARNDWVMLVAPSVVKTGSRWPAGIMSQMNPPAGIVVNYSNIEPDGTFFNRLFRLEFFFQQLKSFGFILNGLPFIVSEENVAFRKQHYFDEGGFRGMIGEPYAQFELVINAFLKKTTTCLLLSDTTSLYKQEYAGKSHFMELMKKEVRLRHYLPLFHRLLLAFSEWIRILLLPAALLLLIPVPAAWPLVIASLFLMGLGYSLIIKNILNRLNEGKLFLPSLLFAFLFPYFKLGYRTRYNFRRRKKRWKE